MKLACLIVSSLATSFVLPGCVERKEHLVISPDGSVLWQVDMRSDSLDDLLNGDAVPTPGGLWIVHQGEERDDDGNVTHTLAAETAFAPKRKLPDGFGTQQDQADGLSLSFPTSMTMERRKDGTYYHFIRRYEPRPWQNINALREEYLQGAAGSVGADPATWTPEQRMGLTQAFARFEVEKAIAFARAAWLESLPLEPQDRYLAVADDLRSMLLTMDYARLSNLLVPPANPAEQEALSAAIKLEGQQLQAEIAARLGAAAQNPEVGALDGSQATAFLAAFDKQRRIFEATEDLNDDGFEITLQMPGIVVASNASQLNGGVSGNTVTWKFKGEQLHDNSIELIATSKLAR